MNSNARNLKRKDPKQYALGAIAELKSQLENSRTESRKAKLRWRIAHWESVLIGEVQK